MSLVIDKGDRPVHIPRNRNAFEFDEEVAAIFENMAQRSIPMYSEIHRLHMGMLKKRLMGLQPCAVADIGASTGRTFRVMRKMLGVQTLADVPGLTCTAYDNSPPMLEKIRAEFPEVNSVFLDLLKPAAPYPVMDVVFMYYVLQFIPYEYKQAVVKWVYDHMAPGGVLVMGQKEFMGLSNDAFQQEYIEFRLANGYTREEIELKTIALKGAMWIQTPIDLMDSLYEAGFKSVQETTRWLNFSTLVAFK